MVAGWLIPPVYMLAPEAKWAQSYKNRIFFFGQKDTMKGFYYLHARYGTLSMSFFFIKNFYYHIVIVWGTL
jgi:hypothetical protein